MKKQITIILALAVAAILIGIALLGVMNIIGSIDGTVFQESLIKTASVVGIIALAAVGIVLLKELIHKGQ